MVYTKPSGLLGKKSKLERQYLGQKKLLDNHLKAHFAQGFLHFASRAEARAILHKEAGGQRTLDGGSTARWTHTGMAKARSEFEVPTGLPIVLIFPDIFDRDVLVKCPEYQFPYKDKFGNKKMGIKTPCPWCRTNKFVKCSDKTGYKAKQIRTIAGFRGRIPIVAAKYKCENPECAGNPTKRSSASTGNKKREVDDSDKVSSHTFTLYEDETWSRYPMKLRERYSEYLYTEVTDGKFGEVFVTLELCFELFKDDVVFDQMARDMTEAFERQRMRAIEQYVSFVEAQGGQWPDFPAENFDVLSLFPDGS